MKYKIERLKNRSINRVKHYNCNLGTSSQKQINKKKEKKSFKIQVVKLKGVRVYDILFVKFKIKIVSLFLLRLPVHIPNITKTFTKIKYLQTIIPLDLRVLNRKFKTQNPERNVQIITIHLVSKFYI